MALFTQWTEDLLYLPPMSRLLIDVDFVWINIIKYEFHLYKIQQVKAMHNNNIKYFIRNNYANKYASMCIYVYVCIGIYTHKHTYIIFALDIYRIVIVYCCNNKVYFK